MNVLGALGYGLVNLLHPRMLWLMVWPMLAATAFWGVAALFLWIKVAVWLAGVLRGWLEPALGFVRLDLGDAALIAAHVILFLLFVPIVYLTGLVILGIAGMPRMVEHVAAAFPALERRRGGSTAGSVWSALAEHADRAEMARLFRERFGALYLLGFLLGLAAYVPVVGFVAPAVFALACVRYLLGALERLRLRAPIAPI
jgi:hypothetical protein